VKDTSECLLARELEVLLFKESSPIASFVFKLCRQRKWEVGVGDSDLPLNKFDMNICISAGVQYAAGSSRLQFNRKALRMREQSFMNVGSTVIGLYK